jgi:hypothetical protein
MPMEYRFDDLDLREEPPGSNDRVPAPCSDRNTCWGQTATSAQQGCSDGCCL